MRLIDAEALKAELLGRIAFPDWVREAVLHIIDNAPTVEYPEQATIKCDTEEDKQKLLSALRNAKLKVFVEDERPQGKWIDTGDMNEYWAEEYQCSICGAKDHWHNYCPNCGAEMKGGEK